jgi:hypothetical protein
VAEIYTDALEWYRKYLFTQSKPESIIIVDFPIGKALRKAKHNPKRKAYTLSYYTIQVQKSGTN